MNYIYLLILSYFHLSMQTSKIENLDLIKCKDLNYPIKVKNISIEIESERIIKFSGTLQTEIDLTSPIQAQSKLKRKFWGIWLPVPCEDNIGTCKFPDLCNFGYPDNTKCPDIFVENNVPCRCPIPKGNYTLKSAIGLMKTRSIIDGKYKGTINVNDQNQSLCCYNIQFQIVYV